MAVDEPSSRQLRQQNDRTLTRNATGGASSSYSSSVVCAVPAIIIKRTKRPRNLGARAFKPPTVHHKTNPSSSGASLNSILWIPLHPRCALVDHAMWLREVPVRTVSSFLLEGAIPRHRYRTLTPPWQQRVGLLFPAGEFKEHPPVEQERQQST